MKTIKLNPTVANNLTKAVAATRSNSNFRQGVRAANSDSADPVYWCGYTTAAGTFMLEYCVKKNKETETNFVNWAKVSGPDDLVERFCKLAEHFEYVEVNETNLELPEL
jgi:hypothetical protein